MKAYLFGAIIIGILILVAVFLTVKKRQNPISSENFVAKFTETKTDSQNGIEISVTPKQIAAGKPAEFTVSFTTHEGDLAFDLAKTSVLKIDGQDLAAERWDGGSGGHHLSGGLKFPKIEKEPKEMVLEIKDIGDANRTFTWK